VKARLLIAGVTGTAAWATIRADDVCGKLLDCPLLAPLPGCDRERPERSDALIL
jgi:hypothetical protein